MGDYYLLLNFLPVRVGVATVDALNMIALRACEIAHVFFKDSIIRCFCFFCLTGPSAFSFVRQLYPAEATVD